MHNARYERKFFLTALNDKQLETMIKLHPAVFSEIYHERQVNSLYFDNHALDFYQHNVQGSQERLKIRLRWYDDLDNALDPNLEFKIKVGLLGTKETIACQSFSSAGDLPIIDNLLLGENNFVSLNKYKLQNLKPVLLISYFRRYFQSADKKYRLTIDRDLRFYQVNKNQITWNTKLQINANILELKYDQQNDTEADKISSFFPFRMTKSSKYVLGMLKVYPQVKI